MDKKRCLKQHKLVVAMLVLSFVFSNIASAQSAQDFKWQLISNFPKSAGEVIGGSQEVEEIAKVASSLEDEMRSGISKEESMSLRNAKKVSSGKGVSYKTHAVSPELLANVGFEGGHIGWTEMFNPGSGLVPTLDIIKNDTNYSANGDWHAIILPEAFFKSNEFVLPANSSSLFLEYNGLFAHSGTCAQGDNIIFSGLYDVTTGQVVELLTIHSADIDMSDGQYYPYGNFTVSNLGSRAGHTMLVSFLGINEDPNCTLGLFLDDVSLTANIDTTVPVIGVVSPVPSFTADTTPNFTFSSSEAGTISYGGDCSGVTTSAVAGNNAITFNKLVEGAHVNCTIAVTDAAGNVSAPLAVGAFTINTSVALTSAAATSTTKSGKTFAVMTDNPSIVTISFATKLSKGKLSRPRNVTSGIEGTTHNVSLTRLKKNTTYYYQVTVTSPDGAHMVKSSIKKFKTKKK